MSEKSCYLCESNHPLVGEDHVLSPTQKSRCEKLVKRGEVKLYREFLNGQDDGESKHREGPYHQESRLYGDYLYSQDREKFQTDMLEWLAAGKPGLDSKKLVPTPPAKKKIHCTNCNGLFKPKKDETLCQTCGWIRVIKPNK